MEKNFGDSPARTVLDNGDSVLRPDNELGERPDAGEAGVLRDVFGIRYDEIIASSPADVESVLQESLRRLVANVVNGGDEPLSAFDNFAPDSVDT